MASQASTSSLSPQSVKGRIYQRPNTVWTHPRSFCGEIYDDLNKSSIPLLGRWGNISKKSGLDFVFTSCSLPLKKIKYEVTKSTQSSGAKMGHSGGKHGAPLISRQNGFDVFWFSEQFGKPVEQKSSSCVHHPPPGQHKHQQLRILTWEHVHPAPLAGCIQTRWLSAGIWGF